MASKLCETWKMDAQTLYSRSGRIMASAGFVFALFGVTALAIDSWLLVATKSWGVHMVRLFFLAAVLEPQCES